ncbi:metallophosphoesterase family protein [Chloroflexota bacterium]
MTETTNKILLLLTTIFMVLGITTACTPLTPSSVPATHLLPIETATHAHTSTTIPTRTLAPTQTPSPTSAPTSTPTPTPTQTPQAIILADTVSEVGYNLPLTIQHVNETEATLFFELETPADGGLLYWLAAEPNQISVIPFSVDMARHQVRLEGLIPGAEYQSAVGLSAGENQYVAPNFRGREWGMVNFRTLEEGEPLRIGVIGDSGLGEGSTLALAEQMASQDLDFVLHTGDVVYLMNNHPDPFEAYAEKYYEPLAPLLHEMPIYPVVGNHDIEWATLWEGKPFYYYAFPPFITSTYPPSDFNGQNQWYAVASGKLQFLMLDTQTLFGEAGLVEQTAWLEERLADERFEFTIPVFHVPPYSSGPHAAEGLVVEQVLGQLFKADQIPIVFSGHEHFYERLEADGIRYLISGGGCSVLYNMVEKHPQSNVFVNEMHFVLVELFADRIEISAITEAGELLDQVNIPLNSPGS